MSHPRSRDAHGSLPVLVALCLVTAILSPFSVAGAQPDPVSGPSSALQSAEPVILPGEVVVETTDPSVDTTSTAFVTALDDLRGSQRLRQDLVRRFSAAGTAAATSNDIVVTYIRSTPTDVQAVVEAAIADWNASLITTAAGPVHVSFDWVDLSQTLPGTLGFAGPTGFVRRSDGLYYPVALANSLDRRDYAPGGVEIEVTISSSLYNQPGGWYVDASNANVPFNRLDLYATMLHEVGHGLGFLGSAERRNGVDLLQTPPDKYDTLVRYQGSRLVDLPNNGVHLTSGELYIDIGGGLLHELYAPSQFYNGSSFAHFDEAAYRNGDPGSLMTPALGSGETERVIDAPTLGVLIQSGWQADVSLLAPSITEVSERSEAIEVSWSVDLHENRVPPLGFEARAIRTSNGQQAARVVTDGTERSAMLTGLTNNVSYRIEVEPVGLAASPGTATFTLNLTPPPGAPTLVNVVGTGFNRTLRWQLEDDGGSAVIRYDVQMSKNGGTFIPIGSSTGTEIDTGRLTNDIFQFRVQAVTVNGPGPMGYSLPTGFTDTVVRPVPLDGEIARLYQAAFNRLPDRAGMDFYLAERASGRTLESVSREFLQSPEFVASYGSLSNQAFVEQLYRNVLGRNGDAQGIGFWTSQINGGRSRASVVVEFAQSIEFIDATQTAALQTPTDGAIYRLYLAYFLRPADAGGAAFWAQQARTGSSLASISNAFALSPEFTDRYGNLTDAEFVELVYANVLSRTPDADGYAFWLDRMQAGMTRGHVMLAFSESPEFVVRTGTTP